MISQNVFAHWSLASSLLLVCRECVKAAGSSRSPPVPVLVQVQGQVLLVQPLLAELEELDLAGEVLADDLLGGLGNGRLVDVAVDLGEDVDLVWKREITAS